MIYHTRTYIAAKWDDESDAIEQLRKWKNSDHWSLDFTDAHDLTQARDSSLNCSIKQSLRKRLNGTKTFVLIVGENTATARAGECSYCDSYNSYTKSCARGNSVDPRSYIEFECEMANKDFCDGEIKKIVVLYNMSKVDKSKCPTALKNVGTHISMWKKDPDTGEWEWDYLSVKNALV